MDLITNIFINNLDFLLIYNLFYAFNNKKTEYNLKIVLVSILWGTTNGVFINYADINTFKFVLYISVFLYTLYLCKKKLHETFIIYILICIIIFITQFLIGIFLYVLPSIGHLKIIVGQILTVVVILFICKFPLYRVYDSIEFEVLSKLLIYLVTILFFIIYHNENIINELIHYAPFGIILLLGVYHSIKNISYYTNTYPSIEDDLKNIITGISIVVNTNEDISIIRKKEMNM